MIKKIYLKYRELISYVLVGGLTTVESLGSYYICVLTVFDPKKPLELQMSNIISWVCAVLFAYFANRVYVFKSKDTNMLAEAGKFAGSRVTTLFIDMLCMAIMVDGLKINDKLAKIIVQFIILVLNYLFSKLFVFKKK